MSKMIFNLGILYTTIAVIQPNEYLNDWNDVHISQGFSWRETSVSFGTLTDAPECEVSVCAPSEFNIDEKAIRVIAVPFLIGIKGAAIVSIADSQPIDIEEGMYELIFSAIPAEKNNGVDRYDFVFLKNEKPVARIIKADDELNPPKDLLMEAHPAI